MPKVNARYVDTPSPAGLIRLGRGSFEETQQRGRCEPSDYSSGGSALVSVSLGLSEKTFTESLILAQDERWRRA